MKTTKLTKKYNDKDLNLAYNDGLEAGIKLGAKAKEEEMNEIERTLRNRIIRILNKIIRMSEDDTNRNILRYCKYIQQKIGEEK